MFIGNRDTLTCIIQRNANCTCSTYSTPTLISTQPAVPGMETYCAYAISLYCSFRILNPPTWLRQTTKLHVLSLLCKSYTTWFAMYSFTISLTVFYSRSLILTKNADQISKLHILSSMLHIQSCKLHILITCCCILVNKLHVRASKQHILTTQAAYPK